MSGPRALALGSGRACRSCGSGPHTPGLGVMNCQASHFTAVCSLLPLPLPLSLSWAHGNRTHSAPRWLSRLRDAGGCGPGFPVQDPSQQGTDSAYLRIRDAPSMGDGTPRPIKPPGERPRPLSFPTPGSVTGSDRNRGRSSHAPSRNPRTYFGKYFHNLCLLRNCYATYFLELI